MKWHVGNEQRLRIFIAFLILYGASIIIRLMYVQIWQHDELTELAKENWDREIPFQEQRGEIRDRHGQTIVANRLAPTLYFMRTQNKDTTAVAKQLAPILNVEESVLLEKLQRPTYLTKLAPEGKNITLTQMEQIQALRIKGLYSGVDYVRDYPYGTLLARLIGFTGADTQGLAGIEYAYDDVLTGKESAIRLFTDAQGKKMEQTVDEWRQGQAGATMDLTIDLSLQQIVERELAQAMQTYEANQALALMMDPNSGAILAIASYPTYHPADYRQVSDTIYNRNLPVFMTYEPGSTFKIITLSAAIEEGVVDLSEEFHDVGYTMVEDARLRCWKREGHGHQTFLQVVENSCNPGFVELGRRLGSERLMDYIEAFGFGEVTGSSLAGEASGILFKRQAFGPVEAATTAFGQGVSVTPIQQVQAVAAIINGGTLYQPYIVDKLLDENGQLLKKTEPIVKRQVVSAQTSQIVREALESVVANGSGRQAYRDGLRVAGKTGTAQKVENGRYKDGDYIVSFIGFAPANNPQVLVYVAVDSPQSQLQFGSVIAAPIVGNILEEAAVILQLPYEEEQLERKYVWGDALTTRTPDFIGLSMQQVTAQLYTNPIHWHGEGNTVVDQLPKKGHLIKQDDPIHLYLSN